MFTHHNTIPEYCLLSVQQTFNTLCPLITQIYNNNHIHIHISRKLKQEVIIIDNFGIRS